MRQLLRWYTGGTVEDHRKSLLLPIILVTVVLTLSSIIQIVLVISVTTTITTTTVTSASSLSSIWNNVPVVGTGSGVEGFEFVVVTHRNNHYKRVDASPAHNRFHCSSSDVNNNNYYLQVDDDVTRGTNNNNHTTIRGSTDADNNNNSNQRHHVDVLWSYVYNLQRARREYNINTTQNKNDDNIHNNNNNNRRSRSRSTNVQGVYSTKKLKEPVISFLHFLQQPPALKATTTILDDVIVVVPIDNDDDDDDIEQRERYTATATALTPPRHIITNNNDIVIIEPLNRAIIQAIRIASSVGDYRLILQLVDSAILYAINSNHNNNNATTSNTTATTIGAIPVLNPRIIGEAVTELYRCKANMNKIRSVWSMLCGHHSNTQSSSSPSTTILFIRNVSAYEINAMLQIHVQEQKVHAALDLFHQYKHTPDAIDAYSISLLLQVLTASVRNAKATPTTMASTLHSERYTNTLQHTDIIPLLRTSTSSNNSPWWQWNVAIRILDEAFTTNESSFWHCNPIWTVLLQLNEACSNRNSAGKNDDHEPRISFVHDGSSIVKSIVHILRQRNIQPDAITSTLLLSNLDHMNDYELAISLLQNSTNKHNNNNNNNKDAGWTLAKPNVYMYSAVLAICARRRQYQTAIRLLNEYESSNVSERIDTAASNVYLYNSAMQSLLSKDQRQAQRPNIEKLRWKRSTSRKNQKTNRSAKERIGIAFELYHRMMTTSTTVLQRPDVVTYNTLLAVMAGSRYNYILIESDWKDIYDNVFTNIANRRNEKVLSINILESSLECLINVLLDRMIQQKIDHDTMTYKNAIRSMMTITDNTTDYVISSVLRLIEKAHVHQKRQKNCGMISMIDVYNEAMFSFADVGCVIGMIRVLAMIVEVGLDHSTDSETWLHFIIGLGNGRMTSSLSALLTEEVAPNSALYAFSQRWGLDWTTIPFPTFHANHFGAAICCCLRESDFESARHVLSRMREVGVLPTTESLHDISRSYAIIALEYSSHSKTNATTMVENPSMLRARSALTILSSIDNPSSSLIAVVSRACCSTGMFKEAQTLLRSLHKRVLQIRLEEYESKSIDTLSHQSTTLFNDVVRILSPLHQDLLRYCGDQGNVTNALSLCEDIQYISRQFMIQSKQSNEPQFDRSNITATIHRQIPIDNANTGKLYPSIGMTVSGWKSLLMAASRSGHWRVCLSTLQFLRPYLEATHPLKSISKQDQAHRALLYGQLETAMNTAVKCLAIRSQYGWIVRVIDDWIEWSGGRRPPRDAALSAIRVLATRGRGEEVNTLLTRCTNIPSSNTKYDDKMYNTMLFVGAITALYSEGLYDEADDAFVTAISQQALPLNIKHEVDGTTVKRTTLDLHGMNQAVAHSAVRISLQQLAISMDHWNRVTNSSELQQFDTATNEMIIITGRGLNSALHMRPVLRPVVQRMLVEEFYPPLSTTSVPGNMGAIRISSNDISPWLEYQRRQKGARLLLLAAVLKNFVAPGGRLRTALAQMGVK